MIIVPSGNVSFPFHWSLKSADKKADKFMFIANSYIKQSGQSWKIWLFLLLLFAGSVLLLLGFTIARAQPSSFVFFVLGGSFLGAFALIWLSISVRCKNCKTRLGWKAISEQSHDSWFLWLLKSETCPVCRTMAASPILPNE